MLLPHNAIRVQLSCFKDKKKVIFVEEVPLAALSQLLRKFINIKNKAWLILSFIQQVEVQICKLWDKEMR